jgi:hypothetical protein
VIMVGLWWPDCGVHGLWSDNGQTVVCVDCVYFVCSRPRKFEMFVFGL